MLDERTQRWLQTMEADTVNDLRKEGILPHKFYDRRDLSRLGISRRLLLRLDVQTIRPNLYYGQHLLHALDGYRPPADKPAKEVKTLKGKTNHAKGNIGKAAKGEETRTLRTSYDSLL